MRQPSVIASVASVLDTHCSPIQEQKQVYKLVFSLGSTESVPFQFIQLGLIHTLTNFKQTIQVLKNWQLEDKSSCLVCLNFSRSGEFVLWQCICLMMDALPTLASNYCFLDFILSDERPNLVNYCLKKNCFLASGFQCLHLLCKVVQMLTK